MTVALVTGANRGIGHETARQLVERGHDVYIGARGAERGVPAAAANALEPGTTATDLTAGLGIGRPAEESARAVVELVTLGADGPTGTLRDEVGPLPW